MKNYMEKWRKKQKINGLCPKCNKTKNNKEFVYCKKCLKKERTRNKNGRKMVKTDKILYKKYLEKNRIRTFSYKYKALQKVSGNKIPFCVSCKTKDIRILTINHKNCDGRLTKETGVYRGNFLIRIAYGKRKIDDLEVRCMNCNILYEYEVGRFKLPDKFQKIVKKLNNDYGIPFNGKIFFKEYGE